VCKLIISMYKIDKNFCDNDFFIPAPDGFAQGMLSITSSIMGTFLTKFIIEKLKNSPSLKFPNVQIKGYNMS